MILMQEQVHYIIISEAPPKAAYHSDMRTFIITRNYKGTTKYYPFQQFTREFRSIQHTEKKLFKISHILGENKNSIAFDVFKGTGPG